MSEKVVGAIKVKRYGVSESLFVTTDRVVVARTSGGLGFMLGGIVGGAIDAYKEQKKTEEFKKLSLESVLKADKHNFAIPNSEITKVELKKRMHAVSWARFIYFGGIGLSAIGLIGLIAGLILKPKMVEVPSRLLDVVKLHERMKISELATRFKTTEADVELAVIKLKSSGEPIEFDRETREVIYTPSKEE